MEILHFHELFLFFFLRPKSIKGTKSIKRAAPDVVELADEPVTQELEEDAVFSRYYEEERPLEISVDISRYSSQQYIA